MKSEPRMPVHPHHRRAAPGADEMSARRNRPMLVAMLAGLGAALSLWGLRDGDTGLPGWEAARLGAWVVSATPSATGTLTTAWPTAMAAVRLDGSLEGAPMSAAAFPANAAVGTHPGGPPSAGMPVPVRHPEPMALAPIRQLTFDGCCPGLWWAADSTAVQFIDNPNGQTGIYAVPLWPPGSLPAMVDSQVSMRAAGTRFLVRPAVGHSVMRDVESGLEWPLPTGGNPVHVAPDGARVVWWEAPGGRAQIDALGRIYAAGIDGAGAQQVGGLWDVSVLGFLPDSVRILALGRPVRDDPTYMLATIDTVTGAIHELARGRWLAEVALAPGGAWAAYLVSLDRDQPDANGVWVVSTEPDGGPPRRLEAFGAYRWRDTDRLVMVPMQPGAPAHALWQFDARSGTFTPLFDPAVLPIRMAGNDWAIAPDGKTLAFVSEDDRNIWVVDLP